MKLGLSTDFGSPHHWERLVDFAARHGVDRLVFWGDYSVARFTPPWLYPTRPALLTDEWRAVRTTVREHMAHAAQLTGEAGMEFWHCFQVLMLPPVDHVRRVWPEVFNAHGEPDMSHPAIHDLIRSQVAEALDIAPDLYGLELWIMECADVKVSHLQHQSIPLEEIIERIVGTVHEECRRRDLRLAVDLHTAGGHKATLDTILASARKRPDLIVSADNVVGDFHLHLPFNEHLKRAARTNPVQVHFDLNGEYWGRNFMPTVALDQYTRHIAEAQAIGAEYLDGRISTGHDSWGPHDNLLPSRRRFYPALQHLKPGNPLPNNIEVCCFDTLGGFNAEYFVRHAKDPSVRPSDVVQEFLAQEFGPEAGELAGLLERLEPVNGRIYFADKNYFGAQSILCQVSLVDFWALDVHLTTPAGEPFPPAQEGGPSAQNAPGRAAFAGWPVPLGHRAAGPQAMIAEKVLAVTETRSFLELARHATAHFRPEHREFVVRQFEDLALRARAAAALLEAMAHHFHLKAGKRNGDIPDPARFQQALREMQELALQWRTRYPDRRWGMDYWLDEWHKLMTQQT